MVAAEAFERGRPVASTALGSLRDLIAPEVGWTAEPNADAFADPRWSKLLFGGQEVTKWSTRGDVK